MFMVTPAFSSDDSDVVATTYHRISPVALLGLLLGLASPLAVLSPLLWILPAGALIASAIGIVHTSRPDSELAGKKVAQLGLFLAVLFGVGGPTRWWAERTWMAREAREFVGAWLDRFQQGDAAKAFELSKTHVGRRTAEVDLEEYYAKEENQTKLASFKLRAPVVKMLALGKDGEYLFQGIQSTDSDEGHEYIWLEYRVLNKAAPQAEPLRLSIECVRAKKEMSFSRRWSIGNFAIDETTER
jgi:hypothetical protein